MKSFGPPASRIRQPAPREPFEFTFMRDDEPETHQFQARAISDIAGLAQVLAAAKRNMEQALPAMLNAVSKMLDNKDGTPLNWKPVPLPIPEDADPNEPVERTFRGPDGELHPMTEAARFQAIEAGSSRRRWHHLVIDSDEAEVDAQSIVSLFEWLMSLAAGRPTVPSS